MLVGGLFAFDAVDVLVVGEFGDSFSIESISSNFKYHGTLASDS